MANDPGGLYESRIEKRAKGEKEREIRSSFCFYLKENKL